MNKLGKWLVIMGVIVMLIPVIGRLYVAHKSEQLYKAYEQSLQTISEPLQEEEEHQETEEKPKTNSKALNKEKTQAWQCPTEVQEGDVLGKIMIQDINLDILVIEGISDDTLGVGVGHMSNTALPGQPGNCVIAGHRNYTFGSMFNRLNEVKVGDAIDVELVGKVFTYIVTQTMIVEPDDLQVTEQDEDLKELTLITCHPVYSSAHRLIIKGKLKE